jgi:hypothetical protein
MGDAPDGRRAYGNTVDSFALMEDVNDKLKILDYENRFLRKR